MPLGRSLYDVDPEPLPRPPSAGSRDAQDGARDLAPLIARLPETAQVDSIFDDAIAALYTGQEVDWGALSEALETWRPTLFAIATRVAELSPGDLRVPQSFMRRTWRLLDVFQCEAHWQARHGDRARPLAILATLLRLCMLLEHPPVGDARLTRYHAALITRSMVLTSFQDARLFFDAPPDALVRGRAALGETAPDLPSFRAALLGESGQYVATMGAILYNRRGRPFELSGGRTLAIPESAGERGLWLESAREQIHELMHAGLRALCADHRRTLRTVRQLSVRNGPPRSQGAHPGERLTMLGRAQAFVSEALHESGLLFAHAHRIWVHAHQGHALLEGMLHLEEHRQRRGIWPAALAVARLRSGHDFSDPLTGAELRYELDGDQYRLEIPTESSALLAGG